MVSNIHDATFSSNTFNIFFVFFPPSPYDPEPVASLLNDQSLFSVLWTLCEVPLTVAVDEFCIPSFAEVHFPLHAEVNLYAVQ